MPNHAEAIENIVTQYMRTRSVGSADDQADAANVALQEGLEQLQQLHDILIDGLGNTASTEVMNTLHNLAGIQPSMVSATLLSTYLARLRNAVNDYHLRVLCAMKVLAPPLNVVFDGNDGAGGGGGGGGPIQIVYRPHVLSQQQQAILDTRQLMQDTLGAHVARIHMQLVWLETVCNLMHAISGTSTNNAITASMVHLAVRPANMQDSMMTAGAQNKSMVENILLNSLMASECRRSSAGTVFDNGIDTKGDMTLVMRPVLTPDGYRTGAYVRHCTLLEYVSEAITGASASPVVRSLTSGNIPMYITQMTQMLAMTLDPRFPTLKFDNHVYAFTNGTYNILTLEFRPYGSETNRVLAQTNLDAADEAQHAEFQRIVDQENQALDDMSPSQVASTQQSCLMAPRMYIATQFVEDDLTMSLEELERVCEPLMRILTFQEFDYNVRSWIYAVMGRTLFTIGDIKQRGDESWHTALFILGRAGTGKSRIVELITQLLPEGKVGAVARSFEQVFGLESLAGMDAVVASEFPSQLPTDTLQQALCGELISVAGKNKVARHMEWKAQWMIAANKFWDANNENDQLTRRLCIIEFCKFVQNQDTHLGIALRELRARILVLITRWYRHMVRTYGANCSFADATAQSTNYFISERTKLFIMSNPLARFLLNAALFRRTPPEMAGRPEREYYMSWTAMLTKLTEFIKTTRMSNIQCRDYDDAAHSTIMRAVGLRVEMNTQRYDYTTDRMTEDTWIVGCVHRDLEADLLRSFAS